MSALILDRDDPKVCAAADLVDKILPVLSGVDVRDGFIAVANVMGIVLAVARSKGIDVNQAHEELNSIIASICGAHLTDTSSVEGHA